MAQAATLALLQALFFSQWFSFFVSTLEALHHHWDVGMGEDPGTGTSTHRPAESVQSSRGTIPGPHITTIFEYYCSIDYCSVIPSLYVNNVSGTVPVVTTRSSTSI